MAVAEILQLTFEHAVCSWLMSSNSLNIIYIKKHHQARFNALSCRRIGRRKWVEKSAVYRAPGNPGSGRIKSLEQQYFIALHFRVVIPPVRGIPTDQLQFTRSLLGAPFTGHEISFINRFRVAASQWATQYRSPY